MELVLLLASLLTSGLVFPCCDGRKKVHPSSHYSSPAVTRDLGTTPPDTPPTDIDRYRARITLEEYKKSHPTTVSTLEKDGLSRTDIDKIIARRHLRAESRHITHLKEAFVEKAKD